MARLVRILSKPKFLIPTTVFLILFSIFFVFPILSINANLDNVFGVKLLSVSHVPIELDGTTCYIKTTGIAQKGSLQNIQQSKMLTKHPQTTWGQTLALVDVQGVRDPITDFKLIPKIRCDSTPNQTFVLDKADLKYEVLSQNKKLDKVTTWTKSVSQTNDINLLDNKESEINSVTIKALDIEKNLPEKEYNSFHEFRVSGKLVIYYQNFPNVKYSIDIPADSIRVYYQTIVTGSPEDVPRQDTGCPDDKVFVDGTCVPKCSDAENLVDGKCVPKPDDPEPPSGDGKQDDPKVAEVIDPLQLLMDWVTKLLQGDFVGLQEPKFILINIIVIVLLVYGFASLLKPKKVIPS